MLSYIYDYSELLYIFLSFLFPLSHFILFCNLLKIFLARTSPFAVTNITNTHCHSQHSNLLLSTKTHSAILFASSLCTSLVL